MSVLTIQLFGYTGWNHFFDNHTFKRVHFFCARPPSVRPVAVMFPTLVSALASTLSVSMMATMRTTVDMIVQQGHTRGISVLTFCSMLMNYTLWMFYGLLLPDTAIFLVNSINLGIIVWAWQTLIRYHEDQTSLRMVMCAVFGALIPFVLYINTLKLSNIAHASDMVAKTATVICMVMFASPLSLLTDIVAKKDSTGLNPNLAWMGLWCAIAWTTYGILIDNIFVWGPNGFGIFVSLIQIAVIHQYPAKGDGGKELI